MPSANGSFWISSIKSRYPGLFAAASRFSLFQYSGEILKLVRWKLHLSGPLIIEIRIVTQVFYVNRAVKFVKHLVVACIIPSLVVFIGNGIGVAFGLN